MLEVSKFASSACKKSCGRMWICEFDVMAPVEQTSSCHYDHRKAAFNLFKSFISMDLISIGATTLWACRLCPLQLWRSRGPSVFGLLQVLQVVVTSFHSMLNNGQQINAASAVRPLQRNADSRVKWVEHWQELKGNGGGKGRGINIHGCDPNLWSLHLFSHGFAYAYFICTECFEATQFAMAAASQNKVGHALCCDWLQLRWNGSLHGILSSDEMRSDEVKSDEWCEHFLTTSCSGWIIADQFPPPWEQHNPTIWQFYHMSN